MPKYLKVLWSEGMLLGSQHFQQQDLYHESLARSTAAIGGPFAWGVREVDLNADALALGTLKVDRLRVVLLEGEVIDAPENDELPAPRALADVVAIGASTLVWIGLPLVDRYGPNCKFDAEDLPRQVRYRRGFAKVNDMHTGPAQKLPLQRRGRRVSCVPYCR